MVSEIRIHYEGDPQLVTLACVRQRPTQFIAGASAIQAADASQPIGWSGRYDKCRRRLAATQGGHQILIPSRSRKRRSRRARQNPYTTATTMLLIKCTILLGDLEAEVYSSGT